MIGDQAELSADLTPKFSYTGKAGDTASQLRGARAYESSTESLWALAGLGICIIGFLA